MLLAEALALRADQQKRLKELTSRIQDNARVPHGSEPDEDPNTLLAQAAGVTDELHRLIQRVNRTNAGVVADAGSGATISDLMVDGADRVGGATLLRPAGAQEAKV